MPSFSALIDVGYEEILQILHTCSVLDVGRLRVLVAVAREGSVTAAAQRLHYAQPSVSHQLARLEAEVGMPLLQRMGRGIRLTEAGRLLAQRAEVILAQVESARAELDDLAGLRTGRVRITAFPSALATIVPAAAAHLRTAFPDVDLRLADAEPPEALAALRAGEVDVAVVFGYGEPDPADRRDVTLVPLFDEPLYLVLPDGERRYGPRTLAGQGIDDLLPYERARWIAGCERCREHLVSACRQAGFTPEIDYETEDYVAVQALVAAGLGISLLPALALQACRHPGVRVVEVTGLRRRVMAAHHGRPPASRPAQAVLDALVAGLGVTPPA